MLFDLIATIASGFAAAGIVLILNFIVGKRLPGWAVPAAAGAGMLAFAIWSEYSWASRAMMHMPPEVEVASTNQVRAWYRPWTYVVPQVNRLIAVDHRFTRRHAERPGEVMTRVLLMGRWEPSRQFGVVFDCVGHRRADLIDQVVLSEEGDLVNARWFQLEAGDPVMRAACRN